MAEVAVHVIRASEVQGMDCARLEERMPKRFEKAMRYRQEQDRLLCLGAGLLMLDVLGISDERELCFGPNGKPYVPGAPAFSISHSGEVCILACGDVARLGADVEQINERHLDIAGAVYTPGELAWMAADPLDRFFQLWTWKESVMKATGLGMSLEPQSFEVLAFAQGSTARVMGHDWHAWNGPLDDCRLALCSDDPLDHVRIIDAR